MKTEEICIYCSAVLEKILPRAALCLTMLILCVFRLPGALLAQGSDGARPEKTMIAVRADTPPRIDGVLDDQVWQHAPIATGFIQHEPNEGEPATEKTTVQIAYDDEALYVAIVCYDSEPDEIIARLYRRDDELIEGESDFAEIDFDPHHDHQTGNFFIVTPSGTLRDGTIFNDDELNISWDGVWEAKTAIHDQGWTVEYKIPYHVLRFSEKGEYTWGVQCSRGIGRKHETVCWIPIPRHGSGYVSRFGHLEGIRDIHPPKHLELIPFTLGRSILEPESSANPDGRELSPSAGLNLRYGLSTNLSLNATINPDFGQVEADPAVLNLSVFETFFEERRPFFVEGSSIFSSNLFYSRRIGKQPGHLDIPLGSTMVDGPDATTILGAAKLTGKTASKTSIGILDAVTAPEYATIEETLTDPTTGIEQTERREYLIEPLTNYFVGRIQQDVLKGNSRIGLLTTAVNRRDAESAYLGAMDWDLRLGENAHQLAGTISASRSGSERRSGWIADSGYTKTSGWFRSGTGVLIRSPGFNPNDLGYIDQVNRLWPWLWMQFHKEKPWGPFQSLYAQIGGEMAWSLRHEWAGQTERRINVLKSTEFIIVNELKNFWRLWGNVRYDFEAMDDLDTRGGPLIVKPAGASAAVGIQGDSRLWITPYFECSRSTNVEGNADWGFRMWLRIKPVSNAEFGIGPMYEQWFNNAQWVKNVDDNRDGVHDHFIYGEMEGQILDFTARVNLVFTPNLSLQFYMQPFVAVGDYSNLKELARPSSYEFTPYTNLDENPDFSHRSLRSNLVFRWEYRPGSTLFLVWSQSRYAASDDPSFHPWDSMKRSFSDDGQNILLIKLNYWLGM